MAVCDVPELLNIFTKIVREREDYCYLCLRTEDERRLVAPKHFKKFMQATKLHFNESPTHICYMCERQAANALKLFQAAAFATSLARIIKEMKSRYVMSHIMLDNKYFKKIVNKLGLSPNLTPSIVDEEVLTIRRNGKLSETDTLVMDNQEAYETTPSPTVVALTTGPGHNDNTTQIQRRCTTPDEIIVPDNNNKSQQSNASYILLDDDDELFRPPAPVHLNSSTQTNSTARLNSSAPSNLSIQSNSATSTITPTLTHKNLVVTSNSPNLISVQDLISQPMTDKSNFLLHPIFLQENGGLHVPSLSAVILNGMLVFFKSPTNIIVGSQPLGVNEELIKESLKSNHEVYIQNSPSFEKLNSKITKNNEKSAMANKSPQNILNSNSNLSVNTQTINGQNMLTIIPQNSLFENSNQVSEQPQKKKKMEDSILKSALNNKGVKRRSSNVNVTISDISSDLDDVDNRVNDRVSDRVNKPVSKSEHKTDWEDKIPMDVISFVDAVDPNAHTVLNSVVPDGCSTMRLGEVRSLKKDCDVIDLC